MKEIVILSGKGGTGKTSICASFAVLADNAVIVDCDVDAADLHLILKPNVIEEHEFIGGQLATIDHDKCLACAICEKLCRYDSILLDNGKYRIDELACEGCGVCAHFCPADAICMSDSINGHWFVSETRAGTMVHAKLGIAAENSGKLVALIKNKAKEIAKESSAQFVIVDGPPGIGCSVISSLSGADQVVVVAEPSVSGIHDLERVMKLAGHFKVPVSIIINKYDINEEKTNEIDGMALAYRIPVLARIPYDPIFTEAQIAEMSVVEFSESTAAEEIRKAWMQISGQ
jgi:MinD superfamily P-loop ATPase